MRTESEELAAGAAALFTREPGRHYPVLERGSGVRVYDTNGREYLDAMAGVAVANLGHGVEAIADVLRDQAARLAFSHSVTFSNVQMLRLAARVADFAPAGLNSVTFVSGGSEANETAIKMARQYHLLRGNESKHVVIGRWQSYHGSSLGALAATGQLGRRKGYAPMLPTFTHIEAPNCYRCSGGPNHADCGVKAAEALQREIDRLGPESVAAFIAEPVVGAAGGAVVPPDGYLPRIREICDYNDVVLIIDEVITGFGRTGTKFAVDHWGVVPDIITAAKGISAGYAALGAVVVHDKVREVFETSESHFNHGFTYGGNPLACAVGAAVLDLMVRDDLVTRSKVEGAYLIDSLRGRLADLDIVGDIRGLGMMIAVEIVQDRDTKAPFPRSRQVAEKLGRQALDNGLYLYPGTGTADGIVGDHVLICPPLIMERSDIDLLVNLLETSLKSVQARLATDSTP